MLKEIGVKYVIMAIRRRKYFGEMMSLSTKNNCSFK